MSRRQWPLRTPDAERLAALLNLLREGVARLSEWEAAQPAMLTRLFVLGEVTQRRRSEQHVKAVLYIDRAVLAP
jgi:hypothetical protein